jgi:hypothetical protein
MLSPELVERLADLVVERVMAKIGVLPLHGGGQGFESPQLHQPACPDYATIARTKLFEGGVGTWHRRSTLPRQQESLNASAA